MATVSLFKCHTSMITYSDKLNTITRYRFPYCFIVRNLTRLSKGNSDSLLMIRRLPLVTIPILKKRILGFEKNYVVLMLFYLHEVMIKLCLPLANLLHPFFMNAQLEHAGVHMYAYTCGKRICISVVRAHFKVMSREIKGKGRIVASQPGHECDFGYWIHHSHNWRTAMSA